MGTWLQDGSSGSRESARTPGAGSCPRPTGETARWPARRPAAARRLEADGHRVDLVVVVDTFVPPRVLHRAKRADPSLTTTTTYEPLPRKELWRRRIRVPLAGVVRTSPTADAQALEELGVRVARLHRPRPYTGRALVVQGSENRDDPSVWRRHIVTGDVDVLRLECNHLSVVREPHIGDVVDAIGAALGQPQP
ncbi:hypothetical protein P9A14_18845 [Gordonia hongkongensis]|uniref:Uncharacterized protein n=1 Tax=Gordonia hongkongensis TaxID=1701090 RepID=A0AAX3T4U7_9ACTN|nr:MULTISPECIES: hypothetical protein [Gordonia]WFP24168.1 hypothetical protein P9A14_18845 [Gordonia hongkongensis]